MKRSSRRVLFAALAVMLPAAAFGQDAANEPSNEKAVKFIGEVVGNRVYVRSGPDQNYYPVTQLDAGARVQVVGDIYGWYKIEPPKGCYSLIDKTYVDKDPSGTGVVNGNAVWVRTGSDMSDAKYARQLKLDRGAEVKVIGETEGHYKVEPPPGAYVYIHASFVTQVPEDRLGDTPLASVKPAAAAPSEPAASDNAGPATETGGMETSGANKPATADATPEQTPATPPDSDVMETVQPEATPAGAMPQASLATQTPHETATNAPVITDAKARIDAIELEINTEMAKPLGEQSFDAIIKQLNVVARGTTDDVWRQYAERRAQQLANRQSALRLWSGVQRGSRELDSDLQEAEAARIEETVNEPAPPPHFDVTGEFRKSLIFDSPVLPRRFKLVDPRTSPARTIAYVEIPRTSTINPNLYLGRFVGVVAERRFYQEGTVEAIEVFVPRSITILQEAPLELPPDDEIPADALPVTQANQPVSASE